MKSLFQMKSKPHGHERLQQFLLEEYVCIGWPLIGDLTNVTKDELRERLAAQYKYEGQLLGNKLGSVSAFVHTMQEGDYVLIAEGELVHLGVVGEYEYDDDFDNDEDGMCHRRSCKWLSTISRKDLNPEVQELLRHRGTITKFKHPLEMAELGKWIEDPTGIKLPAPSALSALIDRELLQRAVDVLRDALYSDNVERQERAAAALLQYAAIR